MPRRCSALRPAQALAGAALVCAMSASGEARADDPSAFLTWTAPASCPSRDDVARQIRGAAGAELPPGLRARAAVQEANGGWRADVELSEGGEASSRHVEGETCRAVADAVAVMVAIAVTPDAAPPAAPPPPPPPRRAPPPPRDRAPANPLRPWRYAFGAAFLADAGTLPSVGYGGELTGAWAPSRLELEADVRALAPTRKSLSPSSPTQGATFTFAGGGVRGCYLVVTGRVDLAPCAGVDGEWLFASGFGTSHDTSGSGGTATLSLGARLTLRLTPHVGVRAGVDVAAPLVRAAYQISDGGEVYHRSPVAGRAVVGPVLTF